MQAKKRSNGVTVFEIEGEGETHEEEEGKSAQPHSENYLYKKANEAAGSPRWHGESRVIRRRVGHVSTFRFQAANPLFQQSQLLSQAPVAFGQS